MKCRFYTALFLLLVTNCLWAQRIVDMGAFVISDDQISTEIDADANQATVLSRANYNLTAGQYSTMYYPIRLSENSILQQSYAGLTEIIETGDDVYTVKNFLSGAFGWETNDMQASVIYRDDVGTLLTIPGSGQVPLFSQNGEEYCLWMIAYAHSLGKFFLTNNEIAFVVGENDALEFPRYKLTDLPEDAVFGIAYMSESGRGAIMGSPELHLVNGVMKTKEAPGFSTDWEYVEYPLYIYNGEYKDTPYLGAWGIANSYFPCVFTLYTERGIARSIVSVAFDNEQYGHLFYTEDLDTAVIYGTYSKDADTETINIDHDWYIGNKNGCYRSFTDTTIEHFLNTSGVEEVGINEEEAKNALPEYYNLMGIRIPNPIPGQMYIVKEGSTAYKAIY